ncbi:MAG TPA: rhodanese-like domain-containing protein [Fimbriimonas sp.]
MSAPGTWHVASFYRFVRIGEGRLEPLRAAIRATMEAGGLRGLVVLAPEGVNATVAGGLEAVDSFKGLIRTEFGEEVSFKDSVSPVPPFRRITVDVRGEIVGMRRPDLFPSDAPETRLTPAQWHAWMESERPRIVIDVRNRFEAEVGRFRSAIDPGLDSFSDWAAYVDRADLPTDVPILLYCTGGIRCEKGILALRERGYKDVYQLRDGILGYLAEFQDGSFEGDCFVFDDRVALDRRLRPSNRFGICPGCGLAASGKEACRWCGGEFFVCDRCRETWPPVCSKTCRDRWNRHRSG